MDKSTAHFCKLNNLRDLSILLHEWKEVGNWKASTREKIAFLWFLSWMLELSQEHAERTKKVIKVFDLKLKARWKLRLFCVSALRSLPQGHDTKTFLAHLLVKSAITICTHYALCLLARALLFGLKRSGRLIVNPLVHEMLPRRELSSTQYVYSTRSSINCTDSSQVGP